MAYFTQINGATIDLAVPSPVVTLPPTGVLNSFGLSREFSSYNVLNDADVETSQKGDFLAPVVDGEPVPCTYLGGVTFSNAALGLNAGLVSATVSVNPIEGSYFVADTGAIYIVTDSPLNADNLTATATVSPALGPDINVGPLSLTGLVANPLVSPLVPGGTVNGLLNTVIVTQTPNDDDFVLTGPEIGALVCFVAGTLILTPQGYCPVEELRVDDLVSTKDNGNKPLQWIGSRRLGRATLRENSKLQPIHIQAGALGEGIPSSDLFVSPQHRVLVRSNIAQKMFGTNEVLVAAKQLLQLDGINIAKDMDQVEYFHILFDQHEVVFSNGAETESLYTGSEAMKGVGPAAREEIFNLFPELQSKDYVHKGARVLASGRQGRKLAKRHAQHNRNLVA